jgi:hypothetical protein
MTTRTSVFAAVDVETSKLIGECDPRHCSVEFRQFLDALDAAVPKQFDVHLVLYNLWHAQNARGMPSFLSALHTHRHILDQPSRTLVRPAHGEAPAALCMSQHTGTGVSHSHLH